MDMLMRGLTIVADPAVLLLIFLGTVLGVIFGALPGVGASMACALMLPFTYTMNPVIAIAFLVSIFCAAITGGGITAILFRIPGTPASAPTTFDGYPMAQRGEAGKALGISLVCSAIGGIFSAIIMAALSPQLAAAALRFGPSEMFAVSFLGLSVLSCLDSGNALKTMISGLIGLFLACIGMEPMLGLPRLTFGSRMLLNGVEMIPVMIGMFAVTEVLRQLTKTKKDIEADQQSGSVKTVFPHVREFWRMKWTIVRSAVLGTVVGILPGAGATIAAFLCYTTEAKISPDRAQFGKGAAAGIAASETANNAATGGSLVPLLALGIPGGNSAAIMMSCLVMHGVQVGPLLIKMQPNYLAGVFSSMILTNILMVLVSIVVAKIFAKILAVPYSVLGPIIVMLAILGAYALKNGMADVQLMAIAAVFGYAFVKMKFSPAALVLGLVLGSMCEANLRRAITIANGNVAEVFSKPITAVLTAACVLMLIVPPILTLLRSKNLLPGKKV